jgi:hypothetical protein
MRRLELTQIDQQIKGVIINVYIYIYIYIYIATHACFNTYISHLIFGEDKQKLQATLVAELYIY